MNLKIFFLFFILILISGCNGGKFDAFAQCLTEKGAVMYGTEWCSHCQNQKAMFGKSFENIIFVDCDQSRIACDKAGIKGYPTWIINGTNYPGEQQLYKLSDLTGCLIEE